MHSAYYPSALSSLYAQTGGNFVSAGQTFVVQTRPYVVTTPVIELTHVSISLSGPITFNSAPVSTSPISTHSVPSHSTPSHVSSTNGHMGHVVVDGPKFGTGGSFVMASYPHSNFLR